MARFVANDTLRAALLGEACEREALEVAVARFAGVTWDEAEAPGVMWVLGAALTRTHPGVIQALRTLRAHGHFTHCTLVAGHHVSSSAPALAAVLLGDAGHWAPKPAEPERGVRFALQHAEFMQPILNFKNRQRYVPGSEKDSAPECWPRWSARTARRAAWHCRHRP